MIMHFTLGEEVFDVSNPLLIAEIGQAHEGSEGLTHLNRCFIRYKLQSN